MSKCFISVDSCVKIFDYKTTSGPCENPTVRYQLSLELPLSHCKHVAFKYNTFEPPRVTVSVSEFIYK